MLNPEDYPILFEEYTWPWGPVKIKFGFEFPPNELLSNINIVPYDQKGWLIIRQENGWGAIGGTMEPNEHYLQTLKRELMEEAGCALVSYKFVGAFRMEFLTDQTYRPHLPFPISYRLLMVGEVKRVAEPENPEDGEQVLEVGSFPIQQVCHLLKKQEDDGPFIAEMYRFSADFLAES